MGSGRAIFTHFGLCGPGAQSVMLMRMSRPPLQFGSRARWPDFASWHGPDWCPSRWPPVASFLSGTDNHPAAGGIPHRSRHHAKEKLTCPGSATCSKNWHFRDLQHVPKIHWISFNHPWDIPQAILFYFNGFWTSNLVAIPTCLCSRASFHVGMCNEIQRPR